MIELNDAIALVEQKIDSIEPLDDGDTWVIYEAREYAFGWVVFLGSRLWRETKDFKYAVAGNAPYIVNRFTGDVCTTGTAEPIEYYVARYEAQFTPR